MILSWIKSWWRSKDRFDIYKPRHRLIYSYWDGSRIVHVDPMTLYKKVMAKGPEISIAIKIANSPSKSAPQGHEDVLKNVRDIFEVVPWDPKKGTGLTESEAFELLDHFLSYCDNVKKNTNPSQTLSNNSEESSPSLDDAPLTENSLASGCVGSVSKCDDPIS